MQSAGTLLCWVIPDLSYYHHARIDAFARLGPVQVAVVELCNTSGFKAFKMPAPSGASYPTTTLFKDRYYADIPPTEVCSAVGRALDDLKPDVLLVQGWSDIFALAPLLWRQTNPVPAIVASESQVTDESRLRWKERVKARIVAGFSAGLVGGTPHAEYLAALGMSPEHIFAGYDAVDNEHFARNAEESRKQRTENRKRFELPENYFLASARFIEKKNLSRLLQAYARYRELAAKAESRKQKVETGLNWKTEDSQPSTFNSQPSTYPWSLVLLGDGPLRSSLFALRSSLGLDACVQLPGFKQYDELPAYYGLAGAFIHASTTEQWGLVVNEAMASGLPVLVSNRCGCAPDLVQEGVNGFTFDPYDVESLAQLMLKLSTLPSPPRSGRGQGEVSSSRNQSPSLAEMGSQSRRLISAWGPQRFAQGLQQAVEYALEVGPKRATLLDRWLLRALLLRCP